MPAPRPPLPPTDGAPVRLGVVGCGHVAEVVHLPVLARVPEIEVVALADRDGPRLARVAQRFGVPARHVVAAALVADPRVEAVAVCVPPTEHAEVAGAAL